jgi:hypothetical protein
MMFEYLQKFAQNNSILDIFDTIKKYKTKKEKGDAFEAFADFFFRNDERVLFYIKSVYAYWGESLIPESIIEELDLPSKDKGIDLLCETHKGTFWAVQVKFRSNPATNLKWSEELATFESLFLRIQTKNPKLERGILFTSTYDCPEQYPNSYTIYEGVKLRSWIDKQRQNYKENKLSKKQIELINSLDGWIWDVNPEFRWINKYNLLKEYIDKNNKIPSRSVVCEKIKLGAWVNTQKQDYKQEKISQERIELLESLDIWVWNVR